MVDSKTRICQLVCKFSNYKIPHLTVDSNPEEWNEEVDCHAEKVGL